MGRIFEKRKDRMFARWSKMAKAFTKLGKEIAIAVKLGGSDPHNNPRLRMAIQTARSLNMPKDKVEAAIERASAKDTAALEEIVYEAFAPYGVGLVIETATNNPTRTVANVRSILGRYGGTLASSGALDYVFERKGSFALGRPSTDLADFELAMIDHGLEDLFEEEDGLTLICSFENFGTLQKAIESSKIEVKNAGLQRFPLSHVKVNDAQQKEIDTLIEALEEDDDVQHVYNNMEQE